MARPTVFVSSAASGMTDLREALRYELDQRGFEVLAYEEASFPISGDQDALEECLATVRQSGHYLLVLGDSAGRVANGTSPTREEFRAAKAAFIATGRPRMILSVRSSTKAAIDRSRRGESAGQLDDAPFIDDFIAEVESGAAPSDPNWLHRFRDFRELMEILTTRLRLGRNHAETLARRAVLDELLSNLAAMTSRHGESAFPHHWWGEKARSAISLTSDMIGGQFRVVREVANSLGGCFVAGHLGALSTAAMERALLDGHFLEFSVAEQRFIAGDLHTAVRACVADIGAARGVLETSNDWRLNPMSAAAEANRTKGPVVVAGGDVLWALGYVDRSENAFFSQVNLARHLLSREGSPLPSSKQRPVSPIEGAAEGLWRQQVEPSDIEHLIDKGISPFGARIPAGVFKPDDMEEIAQELAKKNLPAFQAFADALSPEARMKVGDIEEILKQSSREVLQTFAADEGEGIERRERGQQR
jgi:hypothetical protein